MEHETLTERVRAELRRLHQDRKFSQKRVAVRLGLADSSAVSHTLRKSGRPITLDFLEAVADEADANLAELVTPPGSLVKQLNADEASVLRYLRRWPASVVRSLLAFLAHFADEEPIEQQTRNLHEYWRRMNAQQREWFYGVAVMLRENSLSPDMLAGISDRLEREQYGREADDAKRRRKT